MDYKITGNLKKILNEFSTISGLKITYIITTSIAYYIYLFKHIKNGGKVFLKDSKGEIKELNL